jgi:hypothetical protein
MESISSETAAAWRERIEKQRASGESIRSWCRANGCQEPSFYGWRSRLGLSPGPARLRRRKPRPVFAEVVIDEPHELEAAELVDLPAASAVEPIRLRLCCGRELILPASMSDQRVAALVCLIEGRGSNIGGGCDSR